MKFEEYLNIDEAKLSEVVLFDKTLQAKLTEYIVDSCKEFKASIRAVEFEENAIQVHYNYGKEAPKDFISEKHEVSAIVIEETKSVLADMNIKLKSKVKSSVSDGVATVTFFCIR